MENGFEPSLKESKMTSLCTNYEIFSVLRDNWILTSQSYSQLISTVVLCSVDLLSITAERPYSHMRL